jgi:hypothetical protein
LKGGITVEKFKEYKREFTDEEMVVHAYEKEMIQNIISRFVLDWGNGDTEKAIEDLWVQEPQHTADASFATNTGFYVGIDEVKRHLVTERQEAEAATLAEFQAADPAKYADAKAGMGMTSMHSCTTPLLFISVDDQYARYLGYDLGMSGKGKPEGGADCYFEVGLLLIELAKENGQWKIWHLVQEHDFSMESGVNYNDIPSVITGYDPGTRFYGDPTVKKEVYDNQYGWEYLFYDMPRPFKTYDEDEGYGPKGKVGRKFYERVEML